MKKELLKLANKIEPFFKNLPPLSNKTKDWFVKYLPIISLIIAILYGISAVSLWTGGHTSIIPYPTDIPGGLNIPPIYNLNFFYYLTFALLVINTIIYLASFLNLRNNQNDNGWLLLFSGSVVYSTYAIISIFASYGGGIGNFILVAIFVLVELYILFQIRPLYKIKLKAKKVDHKKD